MAVAGVDEAPGEEQGQSGEEGGERGQAGGDGVDDEGDAEDDRTARVPVAEPVDDGLAQGEGEEEGADDEISGGNRDADGVVRGPREELAQTGKQRRPEQRDDDGKSGKGMREIRYRRERDAGELRGAEDDSYWLRDHLAP